MEISQEQEFTNRLHGADAEIFELVYDFLYLSATDPGFEAAFLQSIPPGEEAPPIEDIKALVTKWKLREVV